MIFSFDVFDTCLTRTYAYPADLFYELARLMLVNNNRYSQSKVYQLAKLRVLAEKSARKIYKNNYEDIDINKIYNNFDDLINWNIDREIMLKTELALEEDSIYPVPQIKSRIEKLRQSNHEIIFISDMYLPTSFIRNCLLKHGLAHEKDSVYVSGEIGLTKHSGNLFKYVLKQKNCNPEDLFHIGDNVVSDVDIPRQLGIRAELFEDIRLTRYEKVMVKNNTISANTASRFSGINRINRLNIISSGVEKELAQLVSNVIAPLLTVFVIWVLKTAQKNKFKRLYFVSRDGQILYKIAQKIVENQGIPIECRYLYGSRQAWLLPSIIKLDPYYLQWVTATDDHRSMRLIDILARLEIEPENIIELLEHHGLPNKKLCQQLSLLELNKFRNLLIENEALRSNIIKNVYQNRILALGYFNQQGLLDDIPWALVDLGWKFRCQRALKQILQVAGWQNNVSGFYLGADHNHLPPSESGPFFLFTSKEDNLVKYRVVFEHLFTPATHSSVIGYYKKEGKYEPIYKKESDNIMVQYADNLHNHIINYVEEIIKKGAINELKKSSEIAKKIALIFLKNPTLKEVSAIRRIPVTAEQSHDSYHCRNLANPLNIIDLIHMITSDFGIRKQFTFYPWLEGSAALSPLHIKILFYLLLGTKRLIQKFSK